MTIAIYAAHAFSNNTDSPPELCRVASPIVAQSLVDKLKKERIRVKGLDGKTRTVRRYSSVFSAEI